jgi:hypothetical protein
VKVLPSYPVYVPSKGRWRPADATTARFLLRDQVPFRMVVEPQEAEAYEALVGRERLLVLPFQDLGQGSIPARNWIMEHSIQEGHARHWQLDDNIREIRRLHGGRRIPCAAGPALKVVEVFSDRYTNVALAGLNYNMFGLPGQPPFYVNVHVYSCTLVDNQIPYRWRGRFNEDTDLCLQVLAGGLCTVLVNVFLIFKIRTMKVQGGNTEDYQGDGRLRMARGLQEAWPHVVSVQRRFGRPQHRVRDAWRKFDTPLILKEEVDLEALPAGDEFGLTLKEVKPVRSKELQAWAQEVREKAAGQ